MKKILGIIMLLMPLAVGAQTVKDLQQEQQKLQAQIKETDRMLS